MKAHKELHVGVNVLPETYATDSYQNLLFSIFLFRHHTGRVPEYVTVISHGFKRKRFLDLHCPAIRWPLDKFSYVGLDPPPAIANTADLNRAEMENGYGRWKLDLYGTNAYLKTKRTSRGWGPRSMAALVDHLDLDSSESGLLTWEGESDNLSIYPKDLPWDRRPTHIENVPETRSTK